MHRIIHLFALSTLLIALLPDAGHTDPATVSPEYQVKTAYLYNFAKFIEWPKGTFVDAEEPIVIGILGEDPFGPLLDEAVRQRQAQGRSLRTERYPSLADLRGCHLLFISNSETKQQEELLSALADSGVVTIGESPNFTRDGGQIRFFVSTDHTIKIEVNPDAAQRAGIFISSRILKIARIYQPSDRPKAP